MTRSLSSDCPRLATRFSAAMVVVLLAGWIGILARAADPPQASPVSAAGAMDVLAKKGLVKLKPTTTSVPWVLPDDAKIHDKLEEFRKAESADRIAAKRVKDEAVQTGKDREILSKAEKRYQELKGYEDKPESIPRQISKRFHTPQEMQKALIDDMNDQISTLNRLRPKLNGRFAGDMAPALRTAIGDWMTARNNLIVAYLAAEPEFRALDKQYKELAEDADAAAALKSLGKKHHLGSAGFEQDKKAIASAEATALSGEVPFYREGLDALGGLLNETTPVAVRIDTVNKQSGNWAPTDLLTKAGVAIDASAPQVTLTFTANGKKTAYQCRQVTIPKLRFGKYVLENLNFLAMPDNAKELGTQLMSKELAGYDLTPDLDKWLFKIVKKEQPMPEDDKSVKP